MSEQVTITVAVEPPYARDYVNGPVKIVCRGPRGGRVRGHLEPRRPELVRGVARVTFYSKRFPRHVYFEAYADVGGVPVHYLSVG